MDGELKNKDRMRLNKYAPHVKSRRGHHLKAKEKAMAKQKEKKSQLDDHNKQVIDNFEFEKSQSLRADAMIEKQLWCCNCLSPLVPLYCSYCLYRNEGEMD